LRRPRVGETVATEYSVSGRIRRLERLPYGSRIHEGMNGGAAVVKRRLQKPRSNDRDNFVNVRPNQNSKQTQQHKNTGGATAESVLPKFRQAGLDSINSFREGRALTYGLRTSDGLQLSCEHFLSESPKRWIEN